MSITNTTPIHRPAPGFRSHAQRILDHAVAQPTRVVLQDGQRQITARQLDHAVRGMAHRFAAEGVQAGCVVALAAPVSIEAIVARYAATLLGCITTLCPNPTVPDRLAEFLQLVEADVLICFPGARTAAEAASVQAGMPALLHVEPLTPEDLAGHASDEGRDATDYPVAAAARAALVTSGGTTGGVKASHFTFEQWTHTVDTGPCPERRQLICTSLAHVSQAHVDQTLLGGGRIVLLEHFSPGDVLRTIGAERITHLCLVEPLLVKLADHPDVEHRDLSSLVAISHIGADASASLCRRLLGRLGVRPAHAYGASEVGIISLLDSRHYQVTEPDRLDTCGRPLDGVDVRIERADGTAAAAGEEGLIVVHSIRRAGGYVGSADQSAFRPDGWYATGDLGCLDVDGFLHVRGRARDRRDVDGVAVMPLDVQEALCSHPAVRYAVTIPAAIQGDGFDALVLLEPAAKLTVDELRADIRTRYGPHLVPRVLAVADRVPVTEQGKPDRREIREVLDLARPE